VKFVTALLTCSCLFDFQLISRLGLRLEPLIHLNEPMTVRVQPIQVLNSHATSLKNLYALLKYQQKLKGLFFGHCLFFLTRKRIVDAVVTDIMHQKFTKKR